MLGRGRAVLRTLRRRGGWLLLAIGVLGLSAAALASLWAQKQYEAANRALAEDRLDDALRHVNQCMRVWRRSPSAHVLAARIERCRGRYDEAEAHLDEARRLREEVGEDWQLEWILLRAQRGVELEEVEPGLWNCVKENHPDTPAILEALARAYIRHMRYHMALVALGEWLKRKPEAVRALDWRGWVWERLAKKEFAQQDYQRALELDPNRVEVRLRLADLLLEHGATADLAPHMEWLGQNHPERPEVRLLLARYRLMQGRIEEARGLLDEVLAARPDEVEALFHRGQLELAADRPTEAEPWLRKVLRQDSFHLQAYIALHTCLRQQGDREPEAAAVLERIEAMQRDGRRLARLLGQQQLETAPNDPELPSEIGALLLRAGHEQMGLYWLEMVALKRDPKHGPTHRVLAQHYEKKDPAKAAGHRQMAESKN